jgi:hypothetical protein
MRTLDASVPPYVEAESTLVLFDASAPLHDHVMSFISTFACGRSVPDITVFDVESRLVAVLADCIVTLAPGCTGVAIANGSRVVPPEKSVRSMAVLRNSPDAFEVTWSSIVYTYPTLLGVDGILKVVLTCAAVSRSFFSLRFSGERVAFSAHLAWDTVFARQNHAYCSAPPRVV